MAWNEPGGNNRDPWGGGGGRDQGPPDLDEVVKKLSNKFGGLFGGRRGGGGGGSGGPRLPSFRTGGILLIVAAVAALWLASGIYIVDEGKRGVELRFGRYQDTTLPGLSYHLPYPIETVEIVDVAQIRAEEIGYRSTAAGGGRQPTLRTVPREALMLTQDENIVNVQLSVQYQVSNPRDYLFNVFDPDQTLRQVVESTLREVVGRNTMDFVLTEGRSDVVAEVDRLSQEILIEYGTGLEITNVNLRDAQPPEPVQPAFADAIKAREDEQRLINEAEAYRNEILPVARGNAARRREEAQAYKEEIIAQAEGEARRFEQLQSEYNKAPNVTRERLYIETMESVLNSTSKVLLDAEGSNNLLYLPLDRLIDRRSGAASANDGSGSESSGSSSTGSNALSRLRDTSRNREIR
ncbi:MAG: FtsH protease activity modulator HflK [Candidatus Competibacterales bacterium]|nr:FtsH protease activity modulator HflK [Candidatus Competibacterales bacterium]